MKETSRGPSLDKMPIPPSVLAARNVLHCKSPMSRSSSRCYSRPLPWLHYSRWAEPIRGGVSFLSLSRGPLRTRLARDGWGSTRQHKQDP